MTAPQPDALLHELVEVLVEVRRAEARVRERSDQMGIDAHQLLDIGGASVLAPLLITRAQVLVAMAGLRGRIG